MGRLFDGAVSWRSRSGGLCNEVRVTNKRSSPPTYTPRVYFSPVINNWKKDAGKQTDDTFKLTYAEEAFRQIKLLDEERETFPPSRVMKLFFRLE